MVTEYYGPPECDAVSFTVWIVTEYYGPPEYDAVSFTVWIVTEYCQAPAMVCWPVRRMNQRLGMRLCMWTQGSHGLRYVRGRHGPSVSPVAHDADAHEGSVCVKRFCGPVYVLVDLSYTSQHLEHGLARQ